jgi:hypothetical protein
MAEPLPQPAEQADEVEAAEAGPLAEGDKVYLLASGWWNAWRGHTGYGSGGGGGGGAPPGRIANRPLLEGGPLHLSSAGQPQPALKAELEEGRDYVVVRAPSWQLLSGWYGGGPAIERTAVLEGLPPNSKKPRINLHPMRLEIWCHSEKACKYLEADGGVRGAQRRWPLQPGCRRRGRSSAGGAGAEARARARAEAGS